MSWLRRELWGQWLNRSVIVWTLVFVPFFMLYWLTAQHGVSWQDSGGYQIRALRGNIFDASLVLSHPGYVLGASIFAKLPLDSPVTLVNRFSGLGMAIALANLAGMLFFITRQAWIGIMVAVILGVSHAVWWLSTIAEVYTWSVALLTFELWILTALLQSPGCKSAFLIAGLLFLNGIGLTIHNLALLPLPVYILVILYIIAKFRLSIRYLVFGVSAYLFGASLYLIEIIKRIVSSGDMVKVISDALVGGYGAAVLNLEFRLPSIFNYILDSLSLTNILPIFAILGLFRAKEYVAKPLFFAISSITILEIAFVIRYPVPDQFTFLLPTLTLLGILGGWGIWIWIMTIPQKLAKEAKRLIMFLGILSVVSSMMIFFLGPRLLDVLGWKLQRQRELPFRDEARYWLVPWKHNENSAQIFAQTVFDDIEDGSIVLLKNDETAQFPLVAYKEIYKSQKRDILYKRIASRFDLELPEFGKDPIAFCETIGDSPLYTVSPVPGYFDKLLLEKSIQIKVGILYKVELSSDICQSRSSKN